MAAAAEFFSAFRRRGRRRRRWLPRRRRHTFDQPPPGPENAAPRRGCAGAQDEGEEWVRRRARGGSTAKHMRALRAYKHARARAHIHTHTHTSERASERTRTHAARARRKGPSCRSGTRWSPSTAGLCRCAERLQLGWTRMDSDGLGWTRMRARPRDRPRLTGTD